MVAEGYCAECGGQLAERIEPRIHVIKGRSIRVEADRHLACLACGSVSYQGDMLDEVGVAVEAQVRREDGLLSPGEILAVRLKYGFTQSEMETLLGLGPKTWVRWERGKICPSRAADQMMRAIAMNPDLVRDLMERSGVDQPKAVKALQAIELEAVSKLRRHLSSQFPDIADGRVELLAQTAIAEIRRWHDLQMTELRRRA